MRLVIEYTGPKSLRDYCANRFCAAVAEYGVTLDPVSVTAGANPKFDRQDRLTIQFPDDGINARLLVMDIHMAFWRFRTVATA